MLKLLLLCLCLTSGFSETITLPAFVSACFRHPSPGSGTTLIPRWFAPPPPVANPPGYQTSQPLMVSLSYPQFNSAPISEVRIFYTTNGDDPTESVQSLYTTEIWIERTTTIKTLAVLELTPGSFEGPADSRFYSSIGQYHFAFDDRPWGVPRNVENAHGMQFRFIPITPSIPQAFYMGTHEVTQRQWNSVMGGSVSTANPSSLLGDNRPVENVSWYDARRFIDNLNRLDNTSRYRLPTRAEWEAVALFHAPAPQKYYFGNVDAQYCLHGHHAIIRELPGSFQGHSTVGQLLPNGFLVRDILGNVAEWVEDAGANGHDRYACGCSWQNRNPAACARYSLCQQAWPHTVTSGLGFRVVLTL